MKSFVPSPFIHCIVARRGGAGEGIHLQRLSLEMGKWGNGTKTGLPLSIEPGEE